MPSGTRLKKVHLVFKRPGTGISPIKLNAYLGKKITKKIKKEAWESKRDRRGKSTINLRGLFPERILQFVRQSVRDGTTLSDCLHAFLG